MIAPAILDSVGAAQDAGAAVPVTVHAFVAFDWGDEIDLDRARELVPAELHALPRTRRTPASIQYRPFPLRFRLPSLSVPPAPFPALPPDQLSADATVFDFGAVSVAIHVPVPGGSLPDLATAMSEPQPFIDLARRTIEPLFEKLQPAITRPQWSQLSEEFFVFTFRPGACPVPPTALVDARADWLAGLIRLESTPLSRSEIDESLRARMSYGPDDLVIVDWAAAIVVDEQPDEVLDLLAFANLQLLELRQINHQLEHELETAWHVIRRLAGSWLPFWRTHARTVRALGVVKIDAHGMLERTSNILRLVGDPYLARLYQLLVARFHLDDWAADVRRSISLLESVYQVLTQQSATYRAEVLELIIVLLILFEIVSQLWK